jgi:hypothetical protein
MAFLIFLVLAVLVGILIYMVAVNKKSSQPAQPLFRPLPRSEGDALAVDNKENGRTKQFLPSAMVSMQAAAGRVANGRSPHFAGSVHSGPLCWTTGMSRTTCRCSNCMSRRKPR